MELERAMSIVFKIVHEQKHNKRETKNWKTKLKRQKQILRLPHISNLILNLIYNCRSRISLHKGDSYIDFQFVNICLHFFPELAAFPKTSLSPESKINSLHMIWLFNKCL